jgi:quercetin dioxygenase-like cupin family protein/hemerythrin-like domain-containing protein
MRRHPALVPLSHDHHHALVQVRRLREEGLAAVPAFLRFFAAETTRHFREEEELVFPLLYGEEPDSLREVLLQHHRLRALARRLREGDDVVAEVATLLEAHIRLEERDVFELVQRSASAEDLARIGLAPRAGDGPVADLAAGAGEGPLWGTASEDLNATLVSWDGGNGPPEHVNAERDVLYVVLGGGATLELDDQVRIVRAPSAFVVEKGRRRRLVAAPDGVRYLTAHRKRGGLALGGPTSAT